MKRAAALLLLALCAVSAAGQGRLASDFEIAQMEKQLGITPTQKTKLMAISKKYEPKLKAVSDNYVAEKRLDMLDAQLPGLGSAVLFKQVAKTFKDAVDVLGSPLGREVVTVAFNIPKQIAVQSIEAQEKAINQRMSPAKLANEAYADIVAQRDLSMLNGGLGGITA